MPWMPYSSASESRQIAPDVARVVVRGKPVRRVVRLADGLSSVEKRAMPATGPNVSSHDIAASAGTPVMTVGCQKSPPMPLAAEQQLAAALERVGDVALDLVDRRLLDQRADLRLGLEPVADLQLRAPSTSRETNSS